MGETGISYLQRTWNPVVGCGPVSEGCEHCYARVEHDRRHKAYLAGKQMPPQYAKPFSEVQVIESRLEEPLHWRTPRRGGVCFGADLFHPDVPDEFICRVFDVMRQCQATGLMHQFFLLTKRLERMRDVCLRIRFAGEGTGRVYLADQPDDHGYPLMPQRGASGLQNVWAGITAETQARADERIPLLLQTPAAKRWVSLEPMLGPIDVSPWLYSGYMKPPQTDRLTWVVAGCESGPNRRHSEDDWFRSLRDQCVAAGVPFYLKQMEDVHGRVDTYPLLDGRVYRELPEVPRAEG